MEGAGGEGAGLSRVWFSSALIARSAGRWYEIYAGAAAPHSSRRAPRAVVSNVSVRAVHHGRALRPLVPLSTQGCVRGFNPFRSSIRWGDGAGLGTEGGDGAKTSKEELAFIDG